MKALNEIKADIQRGKEGRMILTKTVIRNIYIICGVNGRRVVSAEDVTFVINNTVAQNERVTQKQVNTILGNISKECAKGMRYYDLNQPVLSIGKEFYQYGK